MPKVFLSYSRADINRASEFERALFHRGVSVWRDQHNIYGGQQWPKVIGEAIADRDGVLLLWSANSAASHFVEFEGRSSIKAACAPVATSSATRSSSKEKGSRAWAKPRPDSNGDDSHEHRQSAISNYLARFFEDLRLRRAFSARSFSSSASAWRRASASTRRSASARAARALASW